MTINISKYDYMMGNQNISFDDTSIQEIIETIMKHQRIAETAYEQLQLAEQALREVKITYNVETNIVDSLHIVLKECISHQKLRGATGEVFGGRLHFGSKTPA